MSYSFWRPQPWRPGGACSPLPPSYATDLGLALSECKQWRSFRKYSIADKGDSGFHHSHSLSGKKYGLNPVDYKI